jgi:head-tail adaptor
MRAGSLRHPAKLYDTAQSQNVGGEEIDGWAVFASPRVGIEPLTGYESERVGQTYGQTSHRVTMRYQPGVLARMRLVVAGTMASDGTLSTGARLFEINGILNVDERNRELQLFCKEHVG